MARTSAWSTQAIPVPASAEPMMPAAWPGDIRSSSKSSRGCIERDRPDASNLLLDGRPGRIQDCVDRARASRKLKIQSNQRANLFHRPTLALETHFTVKTPPGCG